VLATCPLPQVQGTTHHRGLLNALGVPELPQEFVPPLEVAQSILSGPGARGGGSEEGAHPTHTEGGTREREMHSRQASHSVRTHSVRTVTRPIACAQRGNARTEYVQSGWYQAMFCRGAGRANKSFAKERMVCSIWGLLVWWGGSGRPGAG